MRSSDTKTTKPANNCMERIGKKRLLPSAHAGVRRVINKRRHDKIGMEVYGYDKSRETGK
jgi:hypothetical protein